jgi:Ser/Thr protein kinase RdoA (MazF antagonist)
MPADMVSDSELAALNPPAEVTDGNRWHRAPPEDPLVRHLSDRFAHHDWEVTRLLGAAYAYRNRASGEQVVAKFYSAKTLLLAEHYAARECRAIDRARRALGDAVVEPFDNWRAVLLMPFVEGLSLESAIAVRRNQAGRLNDRLATIARLLAKLHATTAQNEYGPDVMPAIGYARSVIENLSQHGVLQGDPMTRAALVELVERWAERSSLREFWPAFVHGDATTANFVFREEHHVVLLDWERAQMADPAQDLGRLAAEVTHSIAQHGGNVAEALPVVEALTQAYCAAIPQAWNARALVRRARFFRAISSLRIARNAWSPQVQRMALVTQALALLSTD